MCGNVSTAKMVRNFRRGDVDNIKLNKDDDQIVKALLYQIRLNTFKSLTCHIKLSTAFVRE